MCDVWDLYCLVGAAGSAVTGSAIENLANSINEMVGQAVTAMGTIWVYVGTPDLTGAGSASSAIAAGDSPSGAQIGTILDYAAWIGLAISGISVVWLGVLIAASLRRGEGGTHVGRLGLVLGGVALIGAAGSVVAGLLPAGPQGAAGATRFVQSSLWYYMGAVAVTSVIVAGIRMAWEQRAEPGKDLIRSLFTLIVVAGCGVTVTQMALTASDQFSVWLLQGSLNCDVSADTACFGENLSKLWLLGASPTGTGLAVMVTIVLGLFAGLTSFLQILLMLARAGIVVILAGVLPLSAAATNTESGRAWFQKTLGWLIAWVLYKPAAAIVYAVAFQLVGTSFNSKNAIVGVLTGLMLMLLALVALPVLLRLVTPAVGALAGGSGMGGSLGGAAMAALPTGAIAMGRTGGGGGGSIQPTSSAGGAAGPSAGRGGSPNGAAPVGGGGAIDLRDPAGGRGSGGLVRPAGPTSTPSTGSAGSGTSGAVGAGVGGASGGAAAAAGGPAAPALAAVGAARQAGSAAKQSAQELGGAAAGSPSGSDTGSVSTPPDRTTGAAADYVAGPTPSGSAHGAGAGVGRGMAPDTPGPAPTGSSSASGAGSPAPAGVGVSGGAAAAGLGPAAQGAASVIRGTPQVVADQVTDDEEGPSGSR